MQEKSENLISIQDLNKDPKNARLRTDRSAKLISESLEKFGTGRSIVIDENNTIIAGNGTIEGAKAAGLKKIKVIETSGDEIIAVKRTNLTEDQKVGLAIADNRSSDLSDWDRSVLEELTMDYDLKPFFEEEDLEELLGSGEIKDVEGSREMLEEDFQKFDCTCPRCGFEFNNKK